jgi:hypothetical protein
MPSWIQKVVDDFGGSVGWQDSTADPTPVGLESAGQQTQR